MKPKSLARAQMEADILETLLRFVFNKNVQFTKSEIVELQTNILITINAYYGGK